MGKAKGYPAQDGGASDAKPSRRAAAPPGWATLPAVNRLLLTDGDLALRPTGARSPWLREALADEGDPPPHLPLTGASDADVVIVGGGYTGLWTAYRLLEADPQQRVLVLEMDVCGGGPSGRNGGFVNAWWDELGLLRELYGAERALACAREVARSVTEIGSWCEQHAVDAHYRRNGMLMVSTTPVHDGAWLSSTQAARELGVEDAFRELSAAEIQERCQSPVFRAGALMADAATVHPARLARGLHAVVAAKGATIHEGTRVRRIRREGSGVRLTTDSVAGVGETHAGQVVLATNAWSAGWRPFRRSLVTWSSWMVRTEPIPDLIAERLGWTGGESIVDSRFTVHYFHVTADGRIAFGAGGGRPGYDGRIGPSFVDDLAAGRRAAEAFRRTFPQLGDVRLTDMWGGPIDVAADHLPRFGTLPGGRIHFGFGYSGNGVAPSHLGGQILAGLALGSDEPITRLPIVGGVPRRFPPEPFRYVGARVLREALIHREDAEEDGIRPSRWLKNLTGLPRRLGYHLGPD
jgi:glycine/D-amino acid oxidase-like deaminating enzyme